MKNIKITNFIIVFTAILFAGVFALTPAFAQAADLEVDFQTDPLFNEEVIPGDGVTKTFTVTNNSDTDQAVIVEATNASDDDGLGDVLNLIISSADSEIYNGTLGAFLRAGEVSLSALSSNSSIVYSFAVSFQEGADNSTQNGTLGFDLCVGFEGGNTYCGDTVTGGGGDDGEGGSVDEGGGGGNIGGGGSSNGGASSGGGGGQNIILVITGESVVNPSPSDGTATITWNTNYLSTSQVIYGTSTSAYSINLTMVPYFGYPSGTVEDPYKVTSHSVELSGLTPGATYRFRVVSRASPPTVGYERSFKFEEGAKSYLSYANNVGGIGGSEYIEDSIVTANDNNNVQSIAFNKVFAGGIEGGGAGLSPEDIEQAIREEEAVEEIEKEIASQNTAAAFFAYPQSLADWLKYIIPIILILIVIYIILSRKRKKKHLDI
jgi:hypothetical protein